MRKKVIFLGLGGGLDILSASALYSAAINSGIESSLGELRQYNQNLLLNKEVVDEGISRVNPDSHFKAEKKPRFAGALISEHLGINTWIIATYPKQLSEEDASSKIKLGHHPPSIADRLRSLVANGGYTDIVFVDSGGDCLIFDDEDGEKNKTPWGDHAPLTSLLLADDLAANTHLAVVAAPMDITPMAFAKNVDLLRQRGGLVGKTNLLTQHSDSWPTGLMGFDQNVREKFTGLCDKLLVLKSEDLAETETGRRQNSTMATTFYYASAGKLGVQPCFERKAPLMMEDGKTRAVNVKEEYADIWLLDAKKVSREALRYYLTNLYLQNSK